MELRVLGCHGGETPRHKTSSFLLDQRVAIDAGAVTSMLELPEQKKVETVLVSHPHLDHIKDLATLADNRCQQGGPTLTVAGVPATIAVLRQHFFNDLLWPDFSRIPAGDGPTLRFETLQPETPTQIGDVEVRAVMVDHTIDTSAFIIRNAKGSIAYSGDTGPTDRFWEVLAQTEDLRALLMEVSFPDEHHHLAKVSGHHTPETLAVDLSKLDGKHGLPVLLYHIKPVFEDAVEKQLTKVRGQNMEICRLGDQFLL
ncbi:MAG: 3',5'-cyclic-nucleotide phosphodiesterase [Sandaracinaceae bacterium]|nr:MAG: 3',5'-cyclic-nucleotide phosphodiesterase [Sandaracinaceae bacterium]HBQ13985.1 3',5'-cyclic-nucleotide phosphodiesterase [Myxococcales bacterium]